MRSHGTGGTGISSVPEGVEGHGETEAVVYSENVKSNVLRAEGIRLDEHDSKWGFPRKGSLRQLPPPLLLRARARVRACPPEATQPREKPLFVAQHSLFGSIRVQIKIRLC